MTTYITKNFFFPIAKYDTRKREASCTRQIKITLGLMANLSFTVGSVAKGMISFSSMDICHPN